MLSQLTRRQKDVLRKERQRQRRLARSHRSWDARCPRCGSVQTWCTICNMWTCTGCDPYGTCMCN